MSIPQSLIVGSRESPLALAQSESVMNALKKRYPDIQLKLKTFKTQGDIILDKSLSSIGDKGLFVKELETALLNKEIDFAVHSMKDMPSEQPNGLKIIPFGLRENPHDALVSTSGKTFLELPSGCKIGTSSLRRQAMLRAMRNDIHIDVVRGNVQTRLRKLDEGQFDALVLAAAGLLRLGLESRITKIFSHEHVLPACCQGILAVEIREDNDFEFWQPFIDKENAVCAEAERAFLKRMQGGCQVPLGAYAQSIGNDMYEIRAMVGRVDGSQILIEAHSFPSDEAEAAGCLMANNLLERGGREILAEIIR